MLKIYQHYEIHNGIRTLKVMNTGMSLGMTLILFNIKEYISEKNIIDVSNIVRRLLAKAECLLFIIEFILWLRPMDVMSIERLLANAYTVLGTKEFIMKMKSVTGMIVKKQDQRLQPLLT